MIEKVGKPMHNRPKDKWTKSELTLKCGPVELAKAVIQQWHEDGEPKSDLPAIKYWQDVISQYSKDNKETYKCELSKRN